MQSKSNRRKPFDVAMWHRWIKDRTPDEHTGKLRAGINETRRNIENRQSDRWKTLR
jgi:phage terminase Nu1 subunit (DNA packaging protein)